MTPQETNDAEWRNPENWHGGWLGIYKSERDTRAWVPKRNPAFGSTVNFAHRAGVLQLLLILGIPFGVILLAVLASRA
jgi:uncharacterized membrane protein